MVQEHRFWGAACLLFCAAGCDDQAGPLPGVTIPTQDGGIVLDSGTTPPNPDATTTPDSNSEAGASNGSCMDVSGWNAGTRLSTLSPASFVRFAGATPVRLAVAWTASDGSVFVADRTDPFSDYGSGGAATPPGVVSAAERATLGADGNTVIVTTGGGSALGRYVRTDRAAAWNGASDTVTLDTINSQLSSLGGTVSEPVLGESGQTFMFLVAVGGGTPNLYESHWDDAQQKWASATLHSETPLVSQDGSHRRRPTGISWDDRTLFFYDEVTAVERTASRNATTGNFTLFADIGAFPEATPNESCRELYFQGSDGLGVGVFTTGNGL